MDFLVLSVSAYEDDMTVIKSREDQLRCEQDCITGYEG